MRFERLHLQAFGPFTDEVLDLSGGAPGGLHVIYGPNEAGKSTSLRAVTGFLFGIPHRTGDAHLHPSNKLSLRATVSGGGQSYDLTRLKRRKDDLVDSEGRPLSESPLPELLGNLDERSFSTRFGLDQVELERGAEALLGGSEQGLFAAGTAGATVRRVLEQLEAEAAELYRPRGTKPLLNRALSEYERAQREARRAERPPEKWLEQKRAHESAVERVAELRKARGEVRAELRRLNRLRAVLSDLTAWEDATKRRRELGEEPALPEDATALREACERRLAEARVERRHLSTEVAGLEKELGELPEESSLAEVDDEQLQLSTRAGTALSARKDLPKREASLIEQVRQVRELLSDLGVEGRPGEELDQARSLLPSARSIALVRSLATEYGALATAAETAARAYAAQEREVARLEEPDGDEAPSVQTLSSLEAAVADAQAAQSHFTSLLSDEDELGRARAQVRELRMELGTEVGWEELAERVPGPAPTAAAVSRYQDLQTERRRAGDRLFSLERQLRDLKARARDQKQSDIPTEDKLLAARLARDLKLAQLEKEPTLEGYDALRGAIGASDQLADRLRREADRVAALATLEREIERAEDDRDKARAELEALESALRDSEESQKSLCAALGLKQPCVPSDSAAVFDRVRALVQAESKRAELAESTERKAERIRALESRLRQAMSLPEGEERLPALIVIASRLHRKGLQALERKRERAEGLARAHGALEEAASLEVRSREALSAWRKKWATSVSALNMSEEATVSAAQDALSSFERMGRVLQEAANLERRIAGMERDTQALADDVRAVLSRHWPELVDADPVDAAIQLQEKIRAARRTAAERDRYKKLISERRAALGKVESTILTQEGRLAHLMQAADVEDVAGLVAAEERRREIRALRSTIEGLEASIREKAEGSSLAELQTEADEWRGKSGHLNQRVYDLEEQMEELEDEVRAAEHDEEAYKKGLEFYHSEDVVEARQRATTRAAEARGLLRDYLVKQAAHSLLRGQMEAYAERFAGPILGRASEIFERMTLGRYTKLSIGLGERTLRCVREGQELEVGQLSRGTRAQLYFALRLSSLESYFAGQPTVPLVFDDLFVDFDDNRATAAFEVLAELAGKIQVLYFTHLARDVEAAHDAVPPSLLFEHRLAAS